MSIISNSFDFQFAGYWNIDSQENKLQLYDYWTPKNIPLHGFRAGQQHNYYAKGECLPGHAWETKSILYIDDLDSTSNFTRKNIAKMNGLKIALVVPIYINDNFYGILEFFCRHRITFNPIEIEVFNGIINRIGLSIFIKRTNEELCKLKQFKDQPILKKTS